MSITLCGKVTIITGAISSVGQATAITFARKEAVVTLCGHDPDRLQEVLHQCIEASGGHPERFITVLGDVTEASVRQEILHKTVHAFGRLDILVTNAGVFPPELDVECATEESFDTVFDINVKSVFFLIQLALPSLEESQGNIVCVSSTTSTTTSTTVVERSAPICPMSKAAVDHMTRCLASDLGPKGVRVNAVNPPCIMSSDFQCPCSSSEDLDEVDRRVLRVARDEEGQPVVGVGTPEDVADAVSFLASDAANSITGECLRLDGRRSLRRVHEV